MSDISHSCLLQAIVEHAEHMPDKIALVCDAKEISYKQLKNSICLASDYLDTLSLRKGDSIIITARKEPEFVYLYFGAHLRGIVNVVVDPASTQDKLLFISNTVKPKCIFGLPKFVFDGAKNIAIDSLELSGEAKDTKNPSLDKDDIADIMFTTGTTSDPKAVCLSHYNIASSARNINGFIGNSADEREVLGLPLSHSFGLGRLRCSLLKGATLILIGNFANLKVFFEAMEKYKATGFGMVPAVWEYITKLSGNRIAQFADSLRYIEIGSAPMSIEAKQRLIGLFPNTRICMHYGLTEASRSFFMEFHQYKDNLDTIGMPTSEEVEAKIMNDNGTEMPTGQQGEICVRGNMVMSRYLLDKDNAAAFFGDYFRTGDFGFKNENGLYYMVGRKKELINIGGKKISPLTIEEAIKSLGVIDCAVVPVKDPKGILGEVPKAFIQKMGCQLSFDEIRHGLSGLLEPYEIDTAKVKDLFETYKWDFNIQKRLEQSATLKKLNESSLNTLRIYTYRTLAGEYVLLVSVVRFGGKGAFNDNASTGGGFCHVYDDGSLDQRVLRYHTLDKPTLKEFLGFESLTIPNYDRVMKFVFDLHRRLPYFDLVGWNIALDVNNEPVFIEMNLTAESGFAQMNGGPLFGKYLDEVMERVSKVHKDYRNSVEMKFENGSRLMMKV